VQRVSIAAAHPRSKRLYPQPSSPALIPRAAVFPFSSLSLSIVFNLQTSRTEQAEPPSIQKSTSSTPWFSNPPHPGSLHLPSPSTAPQTRAPTVISPGIADLPAASSNSARTRPHRGTSSSGHRFHHPTAQIDWASDWSYS